jgi:hypothetical protein
MFFEEDIIETTSLQRYQERLNRFLNDKKPNPIIRHSLLWFIHNCIAHPLIGFFPGPKTTDIHDITSQWLNKDNGLYNPIPQITNYKLWLKHNCIAHVLIGLFPCKATFEYHDQTAKEMNVKGWV